MEECSNLWLTTIAQQDDTRRDARGSEAVCEKHGDPVATALAERVHNQQDAAAGSEPARRRSNGLAFDPRLDVV